MCETYPLLDIDFKAFDWFQIQAHTNAVPMILYRGAGKVHTSGVCGSFLRSELLRGDLACAFPRAIPLAPLAGEHALVQGLLLLVLATQPLLCSLQVLLHICI